jgi:hypothetical protein
MILKLIKLISLIISLTHCSHLTNNPETQKRQPIHPYLLCVVATTKGKLDFVAYRLNFAQNHHIWLYGRCCTDGAAVKHQCKHEHRKG